MKYRLCLVAVAFALCFCAMATAAQAQATRTWVSGVGDDANPCSRTAPCKTFAGAISKTADCGEIDALDEAGFGAVTVTKGIKIDGGGGEVGQVASILASGTQGIVINNGSVNCPWDVIRNLDINGTGTTFGTNGINVIAGGTLALENVDIENFSNTCVNLSPASAVGFTAYNSNFEKCGTTGGVVVNYSGAGFERLVLSTVKISKSTGIGLNLTGNVKASIRDSDVNNNIGGGAQASGAGASLDLQHVQVSNNQQFGIHSTNSATVSLADTSVVYNNGTGLLADGGGAILTWSNNWVTGNSPDGSRTGTIVPQ